MSLEQGHFKPIINADKFSLRNLLEAILDSSVGATSIHIGKLELDGKTIKIGKKSIQADNVDAKPGDMVVTYEI